MDPDPTFIICLTYPNPALKNNNQYSDPGTHKSQNLIWFKKSLNSKEMPFFVPNLLSYILFSSLDKILYISVMSVIKMLNSWKIGCILADSPGPPSLLPFFFNSGGGKSYFFPSPWIRLWCLVIGEVRFLQWLSFLESELVHYPVPSNRAATAARNNLPTFASSVKFKSIYKYIILRINMIYLIILQFRFYNFFFLQEKTYSGTTFLNILSFYIYNR